MVMRVTMLLLRRYQSAEDPEPKELQIDELEFELLTAFLKEYLKDENIHHIEVIRLWQGKLSNVEVVGN